MKLAVLGYNLSGIRSGAHVALLELAEALEGRGHAVRHAALRGDRETRFGARVGVGYGAIREAVKWADGVLLRDELRIEHVLPLCQGARVVYQVHSPAGDPREIGVALPEGAVVVWVSKVLEERVRELGGAYSERESVTIAGLPIKFSRYRVPGPGDHVTIINYSARKGGPLFFWLAHQFPEVRFLAVEGWGEQYAPSRSPDNVYVLPARNDARVVYRLTKVLLLPSVSAGTIPDKLLPRWEEAYNRSGLEAAASGIPSIPSMAGGLIESLGSGAALGYLSVDEPERWAACLRTLLEDEGAYRFARERALARVREVVHERPRILEAYERLFA